MRNVVRALKKYPDAVLLGELPSPCLVRFTNPLALRSSKGKRVGEPDLQLHCSCTRSKENRGDVELGNTIFMFTLEI